MPKPPARTLREDFPISNAAALVDRRFRPRRVLITPTGSVPERVHLRFWRAPAWRSVTQPIGKIFVPPAPDPFGFPPPIAPPGCGAPVTRPQSPLPRGGLQAVQRSSNGGASFPDHEKQTDRAAPGAGRRGHAVPGAFLCVPACRAPPAKKGSEPAIFLPSRMPPKTIPLMFGRQILQTPCSRMILLRLDPGNEVISSIIRYSEQERLAGGSITALGAVRDATIGWFLPDKKDYQKREVRNVTELVGATGTLAWYEGKPLPHLHVVLASEDGAVHAGHLFQATVAATCEVTILVSENRLQRAHNSDVGLSLLDFK